MESRPNSASAGAQHRDGRPGEVQLRERLRQRLRCLLGGARGVGGAAAAPKQGVRRRGLPELVPRHHPLLHTAASAGLSRARRRRTWTLTHEPGPLPGADVAVPGDAGALGGTGVAPPEAAGAASAPAEAARDAPTLAAAAQVPGAQALRSARPGWCCCRPCWRRAAQAPEQALAAVPAPPRTERVCW